MKFLNIKLVTLILTVGLLSACGSQPATTAPSSASQPTAAVAVPTQAATNTSAVANTQAPTAGSTPTTSISFANDILPIVNSRCINCHGGDRTEKGLNLKTYDDLMKGSENGTVITPGNADQSKLVQMVSSGKMPKRGPSLTPPQIQLIVDWINQGALNN